MSNNAADLATVSRISSLPPRENQNTFGNRSLDCRHEIPQGYETP
jgi:hypothetical protein